MEFVDAHLHLSDEEYSQCTDEIIADARKASVVALVSSSMDLKTSKESLRLAEQNPRLVYAALGVHPWAVQTVTEDEVQETIKFISQVR
jgi:Tat protein secretion system quality control protein TatD with DNase activity